MTQEVHGRYKVVFSYKNSIGDQLSITGHFYLVGHVALHIVLAENIDAHTAHPPNDV